MKLGRAEKLARDQLIAHADLDAAASRATRAGRAEVGRRAGRAGAGSLAQSQVIFDHTIIRSPTDGIVLSRNVEIGQTVTSGL